MCEGLAVLFVALVCVCVRVCVCLCVPISQDSTLWTFVGFVAFSFFSYLGIQASVFDIFVCLSVCLSISQCLHLSLTYTPTPRSLSLSIHHFISLVSSCLSACLWIDLSSTPSLSPSLALSFILKNYLFFFFLGSFNSFPWPKTSRFFKTCCTPEKNKNNILSKKGGGGGGGDTNLDEVTKFTFSWSIDCRIIPIHYKIFLGTHFTLHRPEHISGHMIYFLAITYNRIGFESQCSIP